MKNIITIINSHLSKIEEIKESIRFCEYLKKVRSAYGISKVRVAKDLHVNYMKMMFLESGRLKRLNKDFIRKLSEYYGLDYSFLEKKAEEYVKENKKNDKMVY